MTKYSTGTHGSDEEDTSCVLCGATEELLKGKISGVEQTVCESCLEQSNDIERADTEEVNTQKVSTESPSSGYTITDPDSSWVENTDYGTATPYLVNRYDERVKDRLQEMDTDKETVVSETKISSRELTAIMDRNAIQEEIGREPIESLETYLSINLIDK